MKILSHPICRGELNDMLPGYFGDMIKAVVDVRQGILGLDAEPSRRYRKRNADTRRRANRFMGY